MEMLSARSLAFPLQLIHRVVFHKSYFIFSTFPVSAESGVPCQYLK